MTPAAAQQVRIVVDGVTTAVDAGCTVAAALLNTGITAFRASVSGELRAPVCGMGVCFECRVRIDGVEHVRACLEPVRDGMRIDTATGGAPR